VKSVSNLFMPAGVASSLAPRPVSVSMKVPSIDDITLACRQTLFSCTDSAVPVENPSNRAVNATSAYSACVITSAAGSPAKVRKSLAMRRESFRL
jgi:hypothetical protein